MTSFTYKQRKLSDLIAKEANSSYSGFARAVAVVTLTGDQVLTLGSTVFRVKDAVGDAKWALATKSADLAETNEFGLVISDYLGEQKDVSGAGDQKVTIVYIGPVVVKDATVFAALTKSFATAPTDADKASLKRLLGFQGVVAEHTIL